MDERIAGRESLEDALDAPVMAVVPQISSWRNKKETRLVTLSAPDTAPAEAYKTARTTLLYMAREERPAGGRDHRAQPGRGQDHHHGEPGGGAGAGRAAAWWP